MSYQAPYKMNEYEEHKYGQILANVGGDSKTAFDYWTRWKILTDLFFFGNEVMGWRYAASKKNYPGLKRKRYRVDPELHKWLADLLMKDESKLIIVPRLHLKSTWVKLRIVQLILQNPNIRIGLFSVTSRLVEKELDEIKSLLSHPMVLRCFKDRVPAPGKDYRNWEKANVNELTVKRDPGFGRVPQEPQVLIAGAGARITGFHFDVAFLDDVIDDSTTTTIEQMRKAEDWWEYLQPILETECLTTITGTPYHYRDLYAKIEAEEHVDGVYKRTNIENGVPIYKSWYAISDFMKMKKIMKPVKYNCQIRCDPTPDEDKIFPPPQHTFQMPLPADEKGYRFYCLVDPAATTESYSDFTAIVIIAVNWKSDIFVVESTSFKRAGDKVADFLIKKHQQYGFKTIGIELGLQTHLRTIIEMKVAEWKMRNGNKQLHLPIMPIPMKKIDKGTRVDNTLGSLVRAGKFLVSDRCTRLLEQMDNFSGKAGDEDDEVDAASMCVYVIETMPQHFHIGDIFRKGMEMNWRDFHKRKKGREWSRKISA